ncbi:MAG: metallophosphoesterase [Clostridia bacterium]|nr:metallophosphoesterase [Clostridia bacterium]
MGKIRPMYPRLLVSAVICADTHIDVLHPEPRLPMIRLGKVLRDAASARPLPDAFIVAGDVTSRGSAANWEKTRAVFSSSPRPAKSTVLALGNHDAWSDGGYGPAFEEFRRAFAAITGREITASCFAEDFGGYRFLFLGSTDGSSDYPVLGEEQLGWLSRELQKAKGTGRPVFVFNHESLNRRHGLPETGTAHPYPGMDPMESGVGKESDRLEAALREGGRVFYFSGHSHMGISGEAFRKERGYASIEEDGDLTLINLPSVGCGNHSGAYNRKNCCLVLEIYEKKVVLRFRNARKKRWVRLPLRDGKPYWETPLA